MEVGVMNWDEYESVQSAIREWRSKEVVLRGHC